MPFCWLMLKWCPMVKLFLVAKRRRKAANFPGASIVLQQLKDKPKKKRVGFISHGVPARGRIQKFCI